MASTHTTNEKWMVGNMEMLTHPETFNRENIRIGNIVWHSEIFPGDNPVAEYTAGTDRFRRVFLLGVAPGEAKAIRDFAKGLFSRSRMRLARNIRRVVALGNDYVLRWDFDRKSSYIEKRVI